MTDKTAQSSTTAWEDLTYVLPPPMDPSAADLLWEQYCAQFAWYDKAAHRNRLAHRILDYIALLSGAAVTVLAALSAPAFLTATVGAIIVVCEGTHKIGQFHTNWLNYRSTAERMRQQGFAYAAGTFPYQDTHTRRDILAHFMAETLSDEASDWKTIATKSTSIGEN